MIHPHFQRAFTTVDSFWTHVWASYSIKSFAGVKLSAAKALVAWSLVLIEEAQEITAQALAEANAQRESLIGRITQLEEANAQREELLDKICQLDKVAESLRSENISLNANTEEAVKARVENFRSQFEFTPDYENLQAFFVNFGARQVLTEVKELHPNLDLSTIEVDYPSPEEAEDGTGQSPIDGAEDLTDQHLAEGA
ncbi:hypothetical protein Adt_32450 [Abeliophyllum distichum]|uniref:Uncharacterized protein n=1 Tax=Abeliophyllum distichum TaxID=126358 RepID=A0ABD1QX18_9LAMI